MSHSACHVVTPRSALAICDRSSGVLWGRLPLRYVLRNRGIDGLPPGERGFDGTRSVLGLDDEQSIDSPALPMLPGRVQMPEHLVPHSHPGGGSRRAALAALPLDYHHTVSRGEINIRLSSVPRARTRRRLRFVVPADS